MAPDARGAPVTGDAAARRGLRTLWLILAVCAAPLVASLVAFFLLPSHDRTNYGELLPTQAAPGLAGVRADGAAWTLADERGHWVVLVAAGGACDDACAKRLYATRQTRTMQGKDRERVVRVWLLTDAAAPRPATLAEHPDLVVVRADARSAGRLPKGPDAIYLVDPLGNQVLAWPSDPDVRAMAKDVSKLLRTSRIG